MKVQLQKMLVVGVIILCIVLPMVRQNVYFDRDPQLLLLREMMPYWDRTEAGGIALLAKPPREQAQLTYRMLVGLPTDGSDDARLTEKWQAALPSLIDKLAQCLQKAELTPGIYTFPNPYYPLIKGGQFKGSSISLNSDGDDPVIDVPQTETVTFTVTKDHLKLLRHLNTRSYEAHIEVMDPKRPYGDMTYYFIDMATALGHPITRDRDGAPQFSTNEIQDYERLHGEMLWAVAAFLRYARL